MSLSEPPIVHGIISVSSATVSTVLRFDDGSSISKIDDTLDSTSSNPLTNGATTTAINNITAPPVSNFYVQLIMNPSASHGSGIVAFPTVQELVNTFSSGGVSGDNTGVSVPVSGTYSISTLTESVLNTNTVNVTLRINGTDISTHTGRGLVTSLTNVFLNTTDIIRLNSNTSIECRSEMTVTLVKSDQTI